MSELFQANIHLDFSYAEVGTVQINSVANQARVIRLRRHVPVNSRGSQDIEILIPQEPTFIWPDDLFEAEMERRAIPIAELARRAADKLSSQNCQSCSGKGWVPKTAVLGRGAFQVCYRCFNPAGLPMP